LDISGALRILAVSLVPGLAWFTGSACATSLSFTGSLASDDALAIFTFSLGSTDEVTLETLSYGGGTNAAGQAIASGGFDPVISLFDGTGLLIGLNNDGACPPLNTDPASGACFDALLHLVALQPGAYTVVISESDNLPNGPTFADDFSRAGQGNFTCPSFVGTPGPFCDVFGNQRNGNYALDIIFTTPVSVPEPPLESLLGVALVAFGLTRYRTRRAPPALARFGARTR
jgi:hypothetical protein